MLNASQYTISKKTELSLQNGFFLCFAVLCAYFYKERLFFSDTAFYYFNLINNEQIYVGHGRYISLITQFLPWLMLKLHLPLQLISITFSMSLLLPHYICYFIVAYYYKDRFAGWALILALVLTINYNFYYAISELAYGTSYLILFYTFIKNTQSVSLVSFLITGIILVIFSNFIHPSITLWMAFILLYFIPLAKPIDIKQLFSLGGIMGMIGVFVLLRKYEYIGDWYDVEASIKMQKALDSFQQNGFTYTRFLSYTLEDYAVTFGLPFWTGAIFVFMWRQKSYKLLFVTLLNTLGVLFFLYIKTPDGEALSAPYMEGYLVFVVIFSIIMGMTEVFPLLRFANIKYGCLGILIVFCLVRIIQNPIFPKRIHDMQSLIEISHQRNEGDKWVIKRIEQFYPSEMQGLDWTFAMETLLLSAENQHPVTFFYNPNGVADSLLTQSETFMLVPWLQPMAQDTLHPHYFPLSKGQYKRWEK